MNNLNDLIRIKDAIMILCQKTCHPGVFCPDSYCVEMWNEFENVERVDAVPVVHGQWETDGIMMDDGEYLMTRCTACGEAYEYGYNMPFCPNCGADMRENDENY